MNRAQEIDRENSKMQQEIIRMQSYIGEQEVMIEQHRERLREGERSMGMQVEQGRHMEAALEKTRQDCNEFRRTISQLQERSKQLE
jgi:hypothetical protein